MTEWTPDATVFNPGRSYACKCGWAGLERDACFERLPETKASLENGLSNGYRWTCPECGRLLREWRWSVRHD